MFEVTLLLLAMLLIATYAFLPMGYSMLFLPKNPQQSVAVSDSCSNLDLKVSEDSTLKQSFLAHLQNEIEFTLFPRPTDSVLQRHYDTLVSTEVENRLAAMPDS